MPLARPGSGSHRPCRDVTALVIAREDRRLPWRERLALKLHMAMCKVCPTFERQVLTMRNAMKQWRNDASDDVPPRFGG